jgi:hypothetical protein
MKGVNTQLHIVHAGIEVIINVARVAAGTFSDVVPRITHEALMFHSIL